MEQLPQDIIIACYFPYLFIFISSYNVLFSNSIETFHACTSTCRTRSYISYCIVSIVERKNWKIIQAHFLPFTVIFTCFLCACLGYPRCFSVFNLEFNDNNVETPPMIMEKRLSNLYYYVTLDMCKFLPVRSKVIKDNFIFAKVMCLVIDRRCVLISNEFLFRKRIRACTEKQSNDS